MHAGTCERRVFVRVFPDSTRDVAKHDGVGVCGCMCVCSLHLSMFENMAPDLTMSQKDRNKLGGEEERSEIWGAGQRYAN